MSLDVVWSGASQKQNPEMKEPTGRRIKNRRKMKISKRQWWFFSTIFGW
jgi:hypothetical protein